MSTARPMIQARLVADTESLGTIRTQLGVYYAQHGAWPASREAVGALMIPPPRFQCAGNDYTSDAATGQVGLVITDPGRC